MSIINQMLRDLDARGAILSDSPQVDSRVPLNTSRPALRKAALLLPLLLAGGIAGYLALSDAMNERKPAAVAVTAKREPVSVPVVDVPPPMLDEPLPVPDPSPATLVSAPEREPLAKKLPFIASGKMSRSLVTPKSAVQDTPVVRGPAQTEPAVVKKMAEISPESEAQQLYDEAQSLRRSGKIDAAMDKYRLALERNPGMRNVRIQLARLMQEGGQANAALSLLKAGYDQQADGNLAIETGRLSADLGRRDEALIWLERGRDNLRPTDHALMGALLAQSRRYEDAVKAYQRALAADPGQGGWLLGLGLALESQGRTDEAKMAYRNALERGEFKPEVVKFLQQKIGVPGT